MDSTIKIEARVARRHSPAVAWPTIVLAIALWLGLVVASYLALRGTLSMAVAAVINMVIVYAIYTPLHDAIHSSIVPRRKGLRWVHAAIGMACAAPLWMFFHHHRKSHFIHHARTNMADDTDLYAKGSFARVFFAQIPWALLTYFNPVRLYKECLRFRLTASERRLTMALFAAYAAAALGVVAAGYGVELVVLWLVPWFVGNLLMLTTFGWAPHHDHSETGRYRDTRISLFPGADLLYLYQNLHLIHHMLPSVPFYRYRAVFDELRPLLEQNGARIEGFWPSSPAAAS
ncbi:MAG: fatty acid desaturase [Alphaproteobacteria bacterium]|nr:fatty acid desaturase [Alphaproteobacteria bacterium]